LFIICNKNHHLLIAYCDKAFNAISTT